MQCSLAFHRTGACPVKFFEKDSTADLTRPFLIQLGNLKIIFHRGEIFRRKGAKFTPLNPERLFNWGGFNWGAMSSNRRKSYDPGIG